MNEVYKKEAKKNLTISTTEQKPTYELNKNKDKGIISGDLINGKKQVNKDLVIHKEVKHGLRQQDAENLQGVIDQDLHKEDIYDFETVPARRLSDERNELKKMPAHLKGCMKAIPRKRWKDKQEKRIKKAEKRLAEHQALLASFESLKAQKVREIDDYEKAVTGHYAKQEQNDLLGNKEPVSQTQVLTDINDGLARNVIYNLRGEFSGEYKYVQEEVEDENAPQQIADGKKKKTRTVKKEKTLDEFLNDMDSIFGSYVIDKDTSEEERQKETKKAQDKRKKKAKKTGVEAADEDIIAEREHLEEVLLDVNVEERSLQKKVKDLDLRNPVELKEITTIFKNVIKDGFKPFSEDSVEERETVNDGGMALETGHLVVKDISAQRYSGLKLNAKKVYEFATALQMPVPEELYYLFEINDNPFFKSAKDQFKPEEHAQEAYALLLAATSKIYYSALNRFAGYYVTDGLKSYNLSKDKDRRARNFDIFDMDMMSKVRHIRDMSSAYADRIRVNRINMYTENVPAEEIKDKQLKENVELVKGAQPIAVNEEKKDEAPDENRQEKIYEEWKQLLKKDIRGTEQVEQKDMKQTPWILKDHADKVFQIMQNNLECQNLTGEPLKRYLIALNDNLIHNLRQLNDELPKSSVGEKFSYIPKMKDDFIEHVKDAHFGMLLRREFNFRDLLRNNSKLNDFFDKPEYKAAKNRQREVMKALNEVFGFDFYTNAIHLSDLWANKTMQALLFGEVEDKEAQEKLARESLLKEDEKNEENAEEKKEENAQEKKPVKKDGNILKNAVQKLLSKSDNYGVTDKTFQSALEKIKATVKDNISVIDRKMSLMGICDTAKDILKRDVIKSLGGEYLLGYSIISQDIVEYVVDNMMVYDGNAAAIQRTWDRKFARTGLPARLSAKVERVVAEKINANGHRDMYYLAPKGYKVSAEDKAKWEETNKKTNETIETLKTLYKNDIKDFMQNYLTSDELRKEVTNPNELYTNGVVKLKKEQWDLIEQYFENAWLEKFEDAFVNGKYSKDKAAEKLGRIKGKLAKIINQQLTVNYDEREKLKDDAEALSNHNDQLMARDEFIGGRKGNKVIQERKTIVADDIEKQIYGDPALKKILKNKDDREIFTSVLQEELKNENSALHKAHPYLAEVKSIEQLGELSMIDYAQFFADMKALLTVVSGEAPAGNQQNKAAAPQRLLLDSWRMSGQTGTDVYGIKRKLLKDFLAGGMNEQVFTENLAKYRSEALNNESIQKLRFDAILATEREENDANIKFNYFQVKGDQIKQTARMKKLSYAQKLWYRLQNKGAIQGTTFDNSFSNLIMYFLSGLADRPKVSLEKEIANFGSILDQMKVTEHVKPGEPTAWKADEKSLGRLKKAGYFSKVGLKNLDVGAFKAIKDIFEEIAKEDPSEKKLKFSDCLGEILLFGCGKEYFEEGAAGEEVFLNSNNADYYKNIAEKSKEFYSRRKDLQQVLSYLKIDAAEKEKLFIRLKPVIAGIKDSTKAEDRVYNLQHFGVADTRDLIERLTEMYGDDRKAGEKLEKSKKIGEIYKARRDYIDNFGEGDDRGKFRIVRDVMMRDPETWKKIISLSDDEFVDFMNEQDRIYGTGLSILNSPDYRGSRPINEMYIMRNWDDFKRRDGMPAASWKETIDFHYELFNNVRIQKKSVLEVLDSVQKKMVSAGVDKNAKNGSLLMKLSMILSGDSGAFNLLFNEEDMFEAIKRIDTQYTQNMDLLGQEMLKITMAAQSGKAYADNKEDDELFKEIAEIYMKGEMVVKQKEAMGSAKVIQKMNEEAQKGKQLSALDRAYADYSLLMQIIKPYAFSTTSDKFKATLLAKYKEFKSAQNLERNANIYSDRNVLETKDAVRLEVEIRKNQGKMLEREYLADYLDYREKRSLVGSVGLLAYNADPKFDADTIKAARAFVENEFVWKPNADNEEFIKGLLTERAIAVGINAKGLKDILKVEKQRLTTLDQALREKSGLKDEAEIRRAIVYAFAQNANRTELPLDGTHENDIKEILDALKERDAAISIKRPVSKVAQRDYDEFMEEMDIARYTMSQEQFKDICDKKRKYFELMDACVEKIDAVSDQLKIRVGLYEYFKKDIYEALKVETGKEEFVNHITEQMDKLIGDKVEGRNDLSAEDIKQITLSYLPDSRALMQQISDKTVTAEEKLFSSEKYTRDDVAREIATSGNKDLIDAYNSLTLEEQKVFAIALTFPDIASTESEQLTSNEVLRDRNKEVQREVELQEQLAAYIYDKDFMPRIDYNVVMRRLVKTDRKTGLRRVSKTMFKKAMEYTQFCSAKKKEMVPKDYDKLSDGGYTAETGRELAAKQGEWKEIQKLMGDEAYHGPMTFKDLFTNIAKEDAAQDDSIAKIAEKFSKYDDVQMYMLLHILQDRTALDYTTSAGLKSAFLLRKVNFVNEDKREALRNALTRPDGMEKDFIAELNRSMTNGIYEKAAETLFSYQLRDDVDLTNNFVTKDDFAKDALERKTKVDWKLLERAMTFMEEIESENLKIQLCRHTVNHTTNLDAPNKQARALGLEIEEAFKDPTTNHFDFFNDFLVREARKNPDVAMPLISAYSGLSYNEKMLVVHALKNRDILDVSRQGRFTTAIGMNENTYVNERGRDKLADYYIDHLGVVGAQNVLATSQYDTRSAMRSLVSTQISEGVNPKTKKSFSSMMVGTKVFNWFYIGADRNTGVDWELFGNALKFVRKTEGERKLLLGNAESYRAAGDIDKYGRFMYNYQFMRKNTYRSGNRVTRFLGRRIRAEVEGAIPGYGFGQRIMMMCLSPQMQNKMLGSGFVKPGVSKNTVTDALGYAGLGGTATSGVASALAMVHSAASAGTAIAGEGIQQVSSALSGLYNIGKNYANYKSVDKPLENEAELKKEAQKKQSEAEKNQAEDQKLLTKDNKLNTKWILEEVAGAAVQNANEQEILETATTCINVLSGSSFGIQAVTNFFVGGIRAGITEVLHTARFIKSLFADKAMLDRYFADEGPLGKEIQALKGENLQKVIEDQAGRKQDGSRRLLDGAAMLNNETAFLTNMGNAEIFRKAYGFKDFSEEASFVGWNIVQTLLHSASPYAVDPQQFMRAALLLSALGCKDVIGKQDNDSAQKVYNKLMGTDVR